MRPATFAVCLTLAAGGLLNRAGQITVLPARELEALFADLHARGLFDGAVVVGGEHDVFARGLGEADAARHVPFTPDTPSDGASLAKTFTAALVLDLASQRIVDLDAPVTRLLPELPYPGVTLRHLISHTSGIPVSDYDYFDPYIARDQVRTTEVLLRVLAERKPPLASVPGTSFEYSSFGYDLAALAAGRAAGKAYADLLKERLFSPLGITSAFARPGRFSEFPEPRTRGYRHDGARLEPNDVFDLEAFHGGSNVYISARDLSKWNLSFVHAPALGPAALARATEPAKILKGHSGLTWGSWYYSSDRTSFWYSGHLQGFHSEAFRNVKTGVSIVYVSNNTIEPWLQKGVVRAVSTVLAHRPPQPLVAPAIQPLTDAERATVAGRWRMPRGGDVVIVRTEKTSHIERDGVRYRIIRISPEAYYVPGLDFILGFARDAGGTVSKIYVSSNLEEQWGERRGAR